MSSHGYLLWIDVRIHHGDIVTSKGITRTLPGHDASVQSGYDASVRLPGCFSGGERFGVYLHCSDIDANAKRSPNGSDLASLLQPSPCSPTYSRSMRLACSLQPVQISWGPGGSAHHAGAFPLRSGDAVATEGSAPPVPFS
jgi:hypothetical protein